jgi:hypothetical protein
VAKAKKSIAQVSSEIYALLEPLKADERARILNGVRALFGDATVPATTSGGGNGEGGAVTDVVRRGAQAYFDHKDPKNKSEEFATAARFHELSTNGAVAAKLDFERIIATQARRSFHRLNFTRDIDNAQKSKFFNLGGNSESGYTLSHVGQKFVDALPDRAAAKAIKKAAKTKKARKTKTRSKANAGR